MTVYPYAVTFEIDGKREVVQVESYNAQDAIHQAIIMLTAAQQQAGKSVGDNVRLIKLEPDFTMVRRPTPDPGPQSGAFERLTADLIDRVTRNAHGEKPDKA